MNTFTIPSLSFFNCDQVYDEDTLRKPVGNEYGHNYEKDEDGRNRFSSENHYDYYGERYENYEKPENYAQKYDEFGRNDQTNAAYGQSNSFEDNEGSGFYDEASGYNFRGYDKQYAGYESSYTGFYESTDYQHGHQEYYNESFYSSYHQDYNYFNEETPQEYNACSYQQHIYHDRNFGHKTGFETPHFDTNMAFDGQTDFASGYDVNLSSESHLKESTQDATKELQNDSSFNTATAFEANSSSHEHNESNNVYNGSDNSYNVPDHLYKAYNSEVPNNDAYSKYNSEYGSYSDSHNYRESQSNDYPSQSCSVASHNYGSHTMFQQNYQVDGMYADQYGGSTVNEAYKTANSSDNHLNQAYTDHVVNSSGNQGTGEAYTDHQIANSGGQHMNQETYSDHVGNTAVNDGYKTHSRDDHIMTNEAYTNFTKSSENHLNAEAYSDQQATHSGGNNANHETYNNHQAANSSEAYTDQATLEAYNSKHITHSSGSFGNYDNSMSQIADHGYAMAPTASSSGYFQNYHSHDHAYNAYPSQDMSQDEYKQSSYHGNENMSHAASNQSGYHGTATVNSSEETVNQSTLADQRLDYDQLIGEHTKVSNPSINSSNQHSSHPTVTNASDIGNYPNTGAEVKENRNPMDFLGSAAENNQSGMDFLGSGRKENTSGGMDFLYKMQAVGESHHVGESYHLGETKSAAETKSKGRIAEGRILMEEQAESQSESQDLKFFETLKKFTQPLAAFDMGSQHSMKHTKVSIFVSISRIAHTTS